MQNADWTRKKNITKKLENQKLKKIKNIKRYLKGYIKIGKIIEFVDIGIIKQKFHQHKEPISIKNIDIDPFW